MNIAISGATGFIGSHLNHYLTEQGYEVVPLGRILFTPRFVEELMSVLAQTDVVINLAGAPINKRWTSAYKKKLHDSRIDTTRKLVNSINRLTRKPALFISASAVGYYPSYEYFDEYNAIRGKGFLSDLCNEWENEVHKLSPKVRSVITRFGVVLSKAGGAYPQMIRSTRWKIATRIAPGTQPISWISLPDLMAALHLVIHTPSLQGAINFTTPHCPTNKEFTKAVARNYHSLLTFTLPQFLFKMIYGEAAEVFTSGQRVYPKKLEETGFRFQYPTIESFLSAKSEPF